ncbi:MAG: hypothetical protein IAF58_04070, partial [Leptolyngbya sp.]|nr:hypothetical protein [Candidatus Melainabacteria bacterium]
MKENASDDLKNAAFGTVEDPAQTILREVGTGETASAEYTIVESQSSATMISDLAKAMPSRKSDKRKDESEEPLTKLPRILIGLIYVAFLSLIFLAIGSASGTMLPRMLWSALPLQVFFTFCLFRINEVVALKRKGPPPIHPSLIAVISLISFTCMPMTGYYYNYFSRIADPFFWLWFVAQVCWPLLISQALEKTHSWKRVALMFFCACIPSALLLRGGASPDTAFFLSFSWLFTQFGFLFYFTLRLKEIYENDLKVVFAKKGAKKVQLSGVTKDDIVIRYHSFAGVERWVRQRFTGGVLLKGTRLFLLWLSVPVIGILLLLGLVFMDIALRNVRPEGAAAIQAISANNGMFIKIFLSFVFTLVAVPTIAFLRAPNHLLLNREGLRFLWRHGKYSADGKSINWKDLSSIDLERPAGSTQALDQFR